MSIDSSLKIGGGGISKHRNVLTRTERVARLISEGGFDMSESNPIGLPKVGNRKVVTGGKTKKKKTEETEES